MQCFPRCVSLPCSALPCVRLRVSVRPSLRQVHTRTHARAAKIGSANKLKQTERERKFFAPTQSCIQGNDSLNTNIKFKP
jgi:hypothetical protein